MLVETSKSNFEEGTLQTHVSRLQSRRIDVVPNTEEEAYQKAREGYKYPFYFQIGSLEYADLIDIGYDPPNVDLKTYKAVHLLDKPQLLKKARGIERFYPSISKKDLAFYLTRGRLPDDNRIAEKLKRLNRFEKMDVLNQNLLLLVYGSPEAFASVIPSKRKKNIEEIVLLYDELMGIPSTPGLISVMAGIDLKLPNANVESYLYWKLYRYLEVSSSQTPSSLKSGGKAEVLDFETVIGFNSDQWTKYLHDNFGSLKVRFEARSDFVLNEFYDLDKE